jgi:hypothetical protein
LMLENLPAIAAAVFALGTATGALGIRAADAVRRRRVIDSGPAPWKRTGGFPENPCFAEWAPPMTSAITAPAVCVPAAGVLFEPNQTAPLAAVEGSPLQDLSGGAELLGAAKQTAAQRRRTKGEPANFPAEDHAAALLEWVLKPGGLAGQTVSAVDLIDVYRNMVAERDWTERPWQPVAVAFMRMAGIHKRYEWRGKNRVRVYQIPLAAPARLITEQNSKSNMRAAA